MKAILDLEQSSKGDIILHKEGIFWRAYQVSALLFYTHFRPLKVNSRFVKVVNQVVAHLGFPNQSLEEVIQLAATRGWEIDQKDKLIRIKTGETIEEEVWEKWLALHKESAEDISRISSKKPASTEPLEMVIQKLRSYPILEKSPLETQQFVLDLQKEINGLI